MMKVICMIVTVKAPLIKYINKNRVRVVCLALAEAIGALAGSSIEMNH